MKADHILRQCKQFYALWAKHQTDTGWLRKTLKPLFEDIVQWLFGDSYVDVNDIWGWNLEITQPDTGGRIVIASIAQILKLAEHQCAYRAQDNESEDIDKLLVMLRGSVKKIEQIRNTVNSTSNSGPSASQARPADAR